MLFGAPLIITILLAVGCGAAISALIFTVKNNRNRSSKTNILADGIRVNALEFTEMYEAMYSVSVGKNQKQQEVFAAWNDRVNACPEDNGFKAIFAEKFGDYSRWGRKGKKQKYKEKKANKKFAKKAKKLVKVFFKAGIIREHDVFITGDAQTEAKYELAGGGKIEEGITYEVLAPYWHLADTVVDRGAVR